MPTVEFFRTFAAAHRLMDYEGKCARIHGHNFRVRISITAEELDWQGFVIEFDRIKELVDRLDHRLILHGDDPYLTVTPLGGLGVPDDWIVCMAANPTTEYMAQWFAEEVLALFEPSRRDVFVETELRETDGIMAKGEARK